jgi:hypothetical protein
VSVITATWVACDPDPDVVATATTGKVLLEGFCLKNK